MKGYSMGFDIGTLSSKAVLVDLQGNVVARYQHEHGIEVAKPGYQEESMQLWWQEFCEAAGQFLSVVSSPEEILTIGVTGLIPALCPVDSRGEPVHQAILHTDTRAVEEVALCNQVLPSPVSHGHLLPKLLWYQKHEPQAYSKTWKVFVPHGFIAYHLTGVPAIDYDAACMVGGVFDEEALSWKKGALEEFGLSPELLPEPSPAVRVLGTVSSTAAAETGLSTKTKVIAGVGDTFASMLGGGAYNEAHLMLYLGTSATVIYAEKSPREYTAVPHYGPGRGHFVGRILSFGESISHLREAFRYDDWGEMDRLMNQIEPGAEGLWYFPHYKLQTANSFFGPDSEFMLGYRGRHSRFHMYRAMLEGIAFNARYNISTLSLPIRQINVFGGGANSPEVCGLIADVLGSELSINPKSSTALGIAFLALYGSGEIREYSVLTDVWFGNNRVISPNPENARIYDELYHTHRVMYEHLMDWDKALAGQKEGNS